MEWDEGEWRMGCAPSDAGLQCAHIQLNYARKCSNPATLPRIRNLNGIRAFNHQGLRVARRRVGIVRKRLLPRLQIGYGTKRDLRKKVLSGVRDPRFGGEATLLERIENAIKKRIEKFTYSTT